MTVCTDVYVRPQSCDVISIYPSQVHPRAHVRPSGPLVDRVRGVPLVREVPRRRRADDDEALILLMQAFTTR